MPAKDLPDPAISGAAVFVTAAAKGHVTWTEARYTNASGTERRGTVHTHGAKLACNALDSQA